MSLSLQMELGYMKTSALAVPPTRAHPGDAGWDLTAISRDFDYRCTIENGSIITYRTGIHVVIPYGHFGMLCPRSSIRKKDVVLANSPGIIDSSYRGEILVCIRYIGANTELREGSNEFIYEPGERIAQLLIMPLSNRDYVKWYELDASSLDQTVRGDGGFGSTGA